jgi:hypothetical protein
MVFPVQRTSGVSNDVDAEIAFGLRSRGAGIGWIFPPRLQEALDRSPNLDSRIHGLPVAIFGEAEVRRVGDPLYGDLRRLAELVNAQVAFIPLTAAAVREPSGGVAVELAATLIDVRSGQVLWFGVVKGDVRQAYGPGVLATAADKLARTVLWYEGSQDGIHGDRSHVERRGAS